MTEYYPHLLECTMCDDTQRVYTLGRGVDIDSLSGAEKNSLRKVRLTCKTKRLQG